jgi:aryl-alcohol dehydrogenase-like predicted oxidoreductase
MAPDEVVAESKMNGLAHYVVHQAYYSLIGREYEWELMPLGLDQGIGLMAWSPLGFGRLTVKVRRGQPPQTGRIANGRGTGGPPADDDYVFAVVDVLDNIAKETGKTVSQISLNWLLNRPTVVNVIVGARNEEQLKENLGAIGWTLSDEQLARLDDVSHREPIYPYWHQKKYDERNPKPTTW